MAEPAMKRGRVAMTDDISSIVSPYEDRPILVQQFTSMGQRIIGVFDFARLPRLLVDISEGKYWDVLVDPQYTNWTNNILYFSYTPPNVVLPPTQNRYGLSAAGQAGVSLRYGPDPRVPQFVDSLNVLPKSIASILRDIRVGIEAREVEIAEQQQRELIAHEAKAALVTDVQGLIRGMLGYNRRRRPSTNRTTTVNVPKYGVQRRTSMHGVVVG